jgi:hypothetical protein
LISQVAARRSRCTTTWARSTRWSSGRDALEATIAELVPGSPWAQTVARLRCLRGIDTLSAVGLCAEIGDWERFARAGQLMSFLGLVPSERSTSEQRRHGAITKSGSRHGRRLLVEAAWHYRRAPAKGAAPTYRERGVGRGGPRLRGEADVTRAEGAAARVAGLWAGAGRAVVRVPQRTGLAVVAKSPIGRLLAVATERGWHRPRFVSSNGTTCNRDYLGETADGEQRATGSTSSSATATRSPPLVQRGPRPTGPSPYRRACSERRILYIERRPP